MTKNAKFPEDWPARLQFESDLAVLQNVQYAFSHRRKPEHFTNYSHCEECAEHDELLLSRDIHSLRIEDVRPGWDPICFISPEGFAYYLPALIRLALSEPSEKWGWYGGQLLFHLCSDGVRNERILACTTGERRAVVSFLRHLVETRVEWLDAERKSDELLNAIEYWSEELG